MVDSSRVCQAHPGSLGSDRNNNWCFLLGLFGGPLFLYCCILILVFHHPHKCCLSSHQCCFLSLGQLLHILFGRANIFDLFLSPLQLGLGKVPLGERMLSSMSKLQDPIAELSITFSFSKSGRIIYMLAEVMSSVVCFLNYLN